MDKFKYLYFDIETSGKYESLAEMKSKSPKQYSLFCEKVDSKRENDKSWDCDYEKAYEKHAALYAEYGRVVCISWAFYNNAGELKIGSIINSDEEKVMKEAKRLFDAANQRGLMLCGYNIKSFDLGFLFKKFIEYKIVPPVNVNFFNKKPWELTCLDLMEVWKNTSNQMVARLDEFAFMLGVKSPKDEMHGDNVHEKFFNNQLDDISKYCEKDVKCCVDCVEVLSSLI